MLDETLVPGFVAVCVVVFVDYIAFFLACIDIILLFKVNIILLHIRT